MALQKQKIILFLCLLLVFSVPVIAQARGLVPCGGYNADGSREPRCNIQHIFILVARVTNFLIAMAGVFAVYELIGAGFWMIVSAGNEEAISKRKSQASAAVFGFIMVMMAYLFVNTVVNFMITRSLVSGDPKSATYQKCRLNLSDPLTYLTIDPKGCSSIPDEQLYKP